MPFLTGACATHPLFKRTETVQEQKLIIPEQRTVEAVGTNQVEVITPSIAITNYTTNVVVRVNPYWESAIRTVKEMNSNLNPTPSVTPINWLLGGLSAVLASVAAAKTRKASLVPTLVQAIEASGFQGVKAKAAAISKDHGNSDLLHKVVKQLTDSPQAD